MADFARLVLDADTRGLKRGEGDLRKFSNEASSTASVVTRSFVRIGGAIASAVAVSGGIGSVIRTNAEFGASMSRVAAISGATAGELEQLRATALQMGADTAFSAAQAADALGFLAMAGFSASEAMEAIPDVLALAAASGMDLAQAADIASNVLSGFGKAADEAGIVSDVLAAAASRTNTNVSQLGQAMSTAAPIAAALGVSMEETAAAIGVMSDAGIQGERAGTALRGVFASLAGPTTQAQEALAKYGLTAKDIDPQTVGLANAMGILAERGLSTADAMIIFGREAASGALVMADTADRMRDLTGEFQEAEGAAQAMAETMRDNLTGDIDQLTGSIETMIITLGDAGVTGALRSMAQAGTAAVNALAGSMNTLINVVTAAGTGWAAYRLTLMAATAATAVSTSGLVAQAGAIAAASARMGILTSATTAATVATRTLFGVLAANPLGAVALAVGVLSAAMIGLGNAQRQARAETDNLIRSLRGLAQARSADFALRRNEAQIAVNELRSQRAALENERARVMASPELMQRPGATGRLRQINAELTNLGLRLVGAETEIRLADRAFEQAAESASKIEVPAAVAASAISNIGSAGKDAASGVESTTAAVNRLNAVLNRASPFRAAAIQMREDLAEIEKSNLSEAQKLAASAAIGEQFFNRTDNPVSLQTGPLEEARKVQEATELLGMTTEELAKGAKIQTVQIAESFAQMSQRIVGSLQNLTNSIRSGDFLGILGGILNIFTQLGSAGVFGSGLQKNLNKPASFDGGGYTGSGARSGGLDGKGGFLAMLHPRETVIDHTRNQRPANDVNVTVGVDPRNGNIMAFVDGRVVQAAPAIANAGAMQAQAMGARSARRTVRR